MPVTLDAPLAWTTASGDDAAMLDQLQPNIVKAHVRQHLVVQFLHFGDAAEGRSFLASLRPLMKSAREHLEEVAAFKAKQKPGTAYLGVGISGAGYHALGISPAPDDGAFRAGMKASRDKLADPPIEKWEKGYRAEIHAVLLMGDEKQGPVDVLCKKVDERRPKSVTVVARETGLGQHNANRDGIEHFGYVDGRSQPLFLAEDIEEERKTTDGIDVWDPTFALGRVVVPDPASPNPSTHFGSYFVFRKLEQNVRAFKAGEEKLAKALGLDPEDEERAGAMIIGRFEDGTPVTRQRADGAHSPVMNNFDYDSDRDALKCPFHGHIRKTNPRGSGGFGQSQEAERAHIMARRGQTYGVRHDDVNAELPPAKRPSGGVGLLFMAFNVDLADQFEFTQTTWANNPDFPEVPAGSQPPGLDQIIGQGKRPKAPTPEAWGVGPMRKANPIEQAVHLKGGEYFFMPSLGFLAALHH